VTAAMRRYIVLVDMVNRRIGRVAMYGIFVMIVILMWSTITKVTPGLRPSLWTLEMAQFVMVAYYLIGGPYSIQMKSNVRMDLLYGSWRPRTRAWVDAFTVFFLITYLVILLIGGVNSTVYAIEYGERSYSSWRPLMWPIKVVMVFGIVLMLLQSVSELCKDILRIRGLHPMETA